MHLYSNELTVLVLIALTTGFDETCIIEIVPNNLQPRYLKLIFSLKKGN